MHSKLKQRKAMHSKAVQRKATFCKAVQIPTKANQHKDWRCKAKQSNVEQCSVSIAKQSNALQ